MDQTWTKAVRHAMTSEVMVKRFRPAETAPMTDHQPSFGALLQSWRRRRRFSQLDLASEASISQRRLSFIETGRAAPSREMVLHLAEHLDVPPRERNALLLAAGFAPLLQERRLDHPDFAAARRAIDAILAGHAPNPALAVDRH
ncbi:helix-turn-helix domain-containing protein [Rubellimicrobium roseum]|uniref:helix-turn-helix domain-containing protein n=1 Tax=Rubellimicrobium roseum TaxID=687525 RepID=UPI001C3F4C90|nr:helix-turn-helix transcriptional regulator [Rubellimicrobium roseum]